VNPQNVGITVSTSQYSNCQPTEMLESHSKYQSVLELSTHRMLELHSKYQSVLELWTNRITVPHNTNNLCPTEVSLQSAALCYSSYHYSNSNHGTTRLHTGLWAKIVQEKLHVVTWRFWNFGTDSSGQVYISRFFFATQIRGRDGAHKRRMGHKIHTRN